MTMELNRIKDLLDSYYDGTTSLKQEKELRDYFNSSQVPVELQEHKFLFTSFRNAREEKSSRAINLPLKKRHKIKNWKYAAAAVILIAFGLGGIHFSQVQQEQEAVSALKETREAMLFLSKNLNKGAEHLVIVNQFEIAKDKILKE